jgi:hypothetical protein
MPIQAKGLSKASRDAEHGEKMIAITLQFFTNGIAKTHGEVVPKHLVDKGAARVLPNAAHGIESTGPLMFNSLAEIPAVIEKLFIEHGIIVHPGRKTRKYWGQAPAPIEVTMQRRACVKRWRYGPSTSRH